MNDDSQVRGRPELSLVPLSPAPSQTPCVPDEGAPAVVNLEREAGAETADRFLARATREYEKGHIIQPLWVRAVAQADGDETLARAAYLRARATAIRLAEREKRADRLVRDARAAQGAEPPVAVPVSPDAAVPDTFARSDAGQRRKYVVAIAMVLGSLAIGVWWLLVPEESASIPPSSVSAALASGRSATGTAPGSGRATGTNAHRPASQEDPNEYFGAKVQELRDAGNWNVLVLYAAEWTRKRPENGAAWKELSIGYANMEQLDDARDAARKAVQFAPGDPASWRNLGQVNLALEEPAAALEAFERAAALNDQDVASLVQVGTLNTQLGRLPAAQVAFDRVLAVRPENVEALCGEALIAQRQGRSKDADALERQLKSVDGRCSDGNHGGAAPAARSASTSALRSPVPAPAGSPRQQAR